MFARTIVSRAGSTYTRFVSRVVPELKGPSSRRFRKVAKLWWATEPQFGRAFTEKRAIVALGLGNKTAKKVVKAKKPAAKPKKVRVAKKNVTVAPAPDAPQKARKVRKIRKIKKVKVAKKAAPAPVVAKKAKAPKRKSVKKAKVAKKPKAPKAVTKAKKPKKMSYKIFRRRVITAAPKGARVSEKFLKDLYSATRLIRNSKRRILYSKDGVRLVAIVPSKKRASAAARKNRSSRRRVKKAAAAPTTH